VLTTRLAPKQLAQKDRNAEFFSVTPVTVEGIGNQGAFSPENWTALVALLGGHRYAMDLAALWPASSVGELVHRLGNVGPLRHIERMIEMTLCRIEPTTSTSNTSGGRQLDYDHCDGKRPYQLLMKRLAVFMGPIKKETTFRYCHDLAQREWEKIQSGDENLKGIKNFPRYMTMWNVLIANKLLFRIEHPPAGKEACVRKKPV
jgi:hypothetical protein